MLFSRDRLRDALDDVTGRCNFEGSVELITLDPQLFVEDVGIIKLPLSDEQARQIIAKARHVPFDKSSETRVDTAVRNTWELDPPNFKITASALWDKHLQGILEKVAETLNIHVPIYAELYKMLLCEKGAAFKSHAE